MASRTPSHWTPQKRDVLDALADDFLHNYGKGRTILAVDGREGAGKTRFADALAERMGRGGHAVFRASVDGFHRPRELRYAAGKDSAAGFYRDSFDYALLRRVLIDPFKMGGSTAWVPEAFDVARDAPIEPRWTTGPDDATLILDGIFLNRPELRGLWNFSVWLDVPAAEAEARWTARDGALPNPRYSGGQELYLTEAKPIEVATAVIDNSDYEHPRRTFADSC
ncbi:MAG: uridine kinase [Rhodoglobus sp.]